MPDVEKAPGGGEAGLQTTNFVIPAEAGIQGLGLLISHEKHWIPASAGMTGCSHLPRRPAGMTV